MYKPIDKIKNYENRAISNSSVQKKSKMMNGFAFLDNRLKTKKQRRLKEIVNNSQLAGNAKGGTDNTVNVGYTLKQKATHHGSCLTYGYSFSSKTTNSHVSDGCIQGKFMFALEPYHKKDLEKYFKYAHYAMQNKFNNRLKSLPIEAKAHEALAALNFEYNEVRTKPEGSKLILDTAPGREHILFVVNAGGYTLCKLGILADDQDDSLYEEIEKDETLVNTVYKNKANEEEYVKGSGGHFTPRTLTRSVSERDKISLKQEGKIKPKSPGSGTSVYGHVAGNTSSFTSFTSSQGDVLNPHGEGFSGGTRMQVDLAKIPSEKIFNLTTFKGVREHLGPSLSSDDRINFRKLWEEAHRTAEWYNEEAKAAQKRVDTGIDIKQKEKFHKEEFGALKQKVDNKKPKNSKLTQQQWQALVDVCRTQEVLIADEISEDALIEV